VRKTNPLKILIIGAGLTGLSTAYYLEKLGLDYTLFEKESYVGGLCSTYRSEEGFIFDKAMHILHLNDSYVRKLVEELINGDLLIHPRKALVYFKGSYIPYPFQVYFYALPDKRVVKDCFSGIRKAKINAKTMAKNYEKYIFESFGDGIANFFMLPYGRKLWASSLNELSSDWAEKFIPKPDLNSISRAMNGYPPRLSIFYYPRNGGIAKLSNAFFSKLKKEKVKLSMKIKKINFKKNEIVLPDGERLEYNLLISSIPLPELLNSIEHAPPDIKNTRNNLRYSSLFNLNLGIDKKIDLYGAQTVYFPDEEMVFYRIGFPSTLSPNMTPNNCSSISVDVSYSKNKPINKLKIKKRIIENLKKIGIIKNRTSILTEKEFDIKYAYVLYDMKYSLIRRKIHAFLTKNNIFSIGRYGAWEYSTMDDALLAGKNIVADIKKKMLK
jgi:protoporphyrinogen oxidase